MNPVPPERSRDPRYAPLATMDDAELDAYGGSAVGITVEGLIKLAGYVGEKEVRGQVPDRCAKRLRSWMLQIYWGHIRPEIISRFALESPELIDKLKGVDPNRQLEIARGDGTLPVVGPDGTTHPQKIEDIKPGQMRMALLTEDEQRRIQKSRSQKLKVKSCTLKYDKRYGGVFVGSGQGKQFVKTEEWMNMAKVIEGDLQRARRLVVPRRSRI